MGARPGPSPSKANPTERPRGTAATQIPRRLAPTVEVPATGTPMPGSPSLCASVRRGAGSPGRTHRTVGSSRQSQILRVRHFPSLPSEPARRCGSEPMGGPRVARRIGSGWAAQAGESMTTLQARAVSSETGRGQGDRPRSHRRHSVTRGNRALTGRQEHACKHGEYTPPRLHVSFLPPHVPARRWHFPANSHGVNWKILEKTYSKRSN